MLRKGEDCVRRRVVKMRVFGKNGRENKPKERS